MFVTRWRGTRWREERRSVVFIKMKKKGKIYVWEKERREKMRIYQGREIGRRWGRKGRKRAPGDDGAAGERWRRRWTVSRMHRAAAATCSLLCIIPLWSLTRWHSNKMPPFRLTTERVASGDNSSLYAFIYLSLSLSRSPLLSHTLQDYFSRLFYCPDSHPSIFKWRSYAKRITLL